MIAGGAAGVIYVVWVFLLRTVALGFGVVNMIKWHPLILIAVAAVNSLDLVEHVFVLEIFVAHLNGSEDIQRRKNPEKNPTMIDIYMHNLQFYQSICSNISLT